MNINLTEIEIKALVDYAHGCITKEQIAMLVEKAERLMAENGLKQEDCLVDAAKYCGMDLTDWHNLDSFIDYGIMSIDYLPGAVDMYYNPLIWLTEQSGIDIDELEEKYYPIDDDEE